MPKGHNDTYTNSATRRIKTIAMVTFWFQGLDEAAPKFVCLLRRFNDELPTPLFERHSGTINMIKQDEKSAVAHFNELCRRELQRYFYYLNRRLKLLSTVNSALNGDVFEMITVTKFQRILFPANFNYRKMITALHLRQEARNSRHVNKALLKCRQLPFGSLIS